MTVSETVRPNSRDAYIACRLSELEYVMEQRTREKVLVITRAMSEQEKKAYFESQAFRNAVNQTKKKDRDWKAFSSGNLDPQAEAEYQKLRGLIESELREGHPVDLPFLRSVQKLHKPLKKVRQVLDCLTTHAPEAFFTRERDAILKDMEKRLHRYFSTCDLLTLWKKQEKSSQILDDIMSTAFSRGLSPQILDHCVEEGRFTAYLEKKLYTAFPDLKTCATLIYSQGQSVGRTVSLIVSNEMSTIYTRLRQIFNKSRIRKALSGNRMLKDMQHKMNEEQEKEKRLQHALLSAIPEHIQDLFPRARRMHRRYLLHLGPTNSGKTFESIQRLEAARNGIYLGPLRLLAFEQFETLNMHDVPCTLVTGEEKIEVPSIRVQSSTIEMAYLETAYDIAVIDEAQMVSDRDRGGAWSAAILGLLADEIHLCASPDAEHLLVNMIEDCGDEVTIIRHERMAPLVVEETGYQFPASVRKGDALIVFSKAKVHALAAELKQLGYAVSLIYGALPPDVRRNQAERFQRGESDIVVSTDAIAMGMNLPIARVVFMESEKYDGDIVRPLTDSEIRQIAGRAGRYGQYDVGYVNAFGFKTMVANALSRPYRPLTHAVIRFPESLLGLPLSLTQTIDKLISMKDRSYYSKASTARMASLAMTMETRNTDKELLYAFLSIPFDETDPNLLSEWKKLYHAEAEGTHIDVTLLLPDYQDPDQCTVSMLSQLEEEYRLCDLYYNYARRFLDDPEKVLTAITLRKDLISSGIIHVLSTQKLQMRTCRSCGRHLPWNWPYTYCDHCYSNYR